MESAQEAFARGAAAGETKARLDGHDKQLSAINGSISRTAEALTELSRHVSEQTLEIQKLRLEAIAREATVITTASALKDAEEARRDKAEQSWSPLNRIFVGLGSIAALIGAVLAIKY